MEPGQPRSRGRAVLAVRAGLRRTFGIWPLFEARNKAVGWPGAVRAMRTERREAQRLGRTVVVPPALVTTVIATCNRPESLVRAVHSALAQTVRDHVVVVVDDGAGLPPLPADERLVAVSLTHNTGVAGVVRNVGIALSGSTFLAFLDDDNEWQPHHLAACVDALERGADLVYTGVERVRPDGSRLDVLSRPFERRALAEESFVDTNSIVVRRGRGVRFSRLARSSATLPKEDWELAWRLSRRLRTVHVPETTVRYVVNPDSYYTRWGTEEPEPPHPR
ncbi:glycosyl transferase [Nocardioides sp. CF8]|uniref:glycosyltransferase family 2 protein n=1 Tax=Nocardioides sp. CF8 TaxID=110319 RepID=UPI00032ED7BA|nr:glycosyltransferase [Nocardioides sp. CF8]EON22951.1 glycosyl transferase [Nocardioides sp. CF8]